MHLIQTTQIPKKNNRGYSIIEAMIALCILSIGLLAIVSMQVSSSSNVRKSGDATEAINLGTERLEKLMSYSYTDLIDLTVVFSPDDDLGRGSGGKFDIRWTITPATPVPNTATMTVSVRWSPAGGREQTITLTSVKADMNL